MATLASNDWGLTGFGHTRGGFVQEGVEVFAASGVLVDVAHGHVACPGPGLHVLGFRPLS